MDLLTILLIVLVVMALGGWGYGTYYAGPSVGPGPWVNPVGIIGAILLIGLLFMLFTGWRFAP